MLLLYKISIIFLFHISSIFSYITIPFTTIKENISSSYYVSSFMSQSYPNKVITKIKIGTPSQDIDLRLKTLRIPLSINSIRMGTYKITRFNESNSSTYIPLHKNPSYYGELDFTNAIKSKDVIIFDDNNCLLNNITFLLGIEDYYSYRESGVLGLQLAEFDWRVQDSGFIKQLKERDLIKNYSFFIKYDNDSTSGEVIIGALPHEVYKEKYDKNKYKEFYAEIVRSALGLRINKAFYGNSNDTIDEDFKSELALEDNFMRGTKNFKENLLKFFFQKYINSNLCQESTFIYLDDDDLHFFYCDKKVNISEFKNITIIVDNYGISEDTEENNNSTHLIVEINYKDLFIEFDKRYYFLMYFPNTFYETSYFKLGKVFFQKYLLNFDLSTKKIGFYYEEKNKTEDNANKEKGKENNNYNLLPWILVGILTLIIAGLIGFILYIKPWKKKKKRANELIDDDYTYEQGHEEDQKLGIN